MSHHSGATATALCVSSSEVIDADARPSAAASQGKARSYSAKNGSGNASERQCRCAVLTWPRLLFKELIDQIDIVVRRR